MTNEPLNSPLQERVQSAIQSGSVKPVSRTVVMLRVLSALLTALIALAAAVLTLSFALYSVVESGEAFLLGFGVEGITLFLMLFPWVFVLAALVAIMLFQWRLAYVTTSYRFPLVPLFVALLLLVCAVGYLTIPFHAAFSVAVAEKNIPILDTIYDSVYESREGYGIYRGVIVSVGEKEIRFVRSDGDADADDFSRLVVIEKGTAGYEQGDEVFIFGNQEDGIIYASHIVAFPDPEE